MDNRDMIIDANVCVCMSLIDSLDDMVKEKVDYEYIHTYLDTIHDRLIEICESI